MKKNIYKNLKKKIEEIRELKYKVKEQMIESEKSEEVTQWSADLENIDRKCGNQMSHCKIQK